MEFYEFFEKIISYIPNGFENIKAVAEMLLPWVLGLMTAATCLFGHTLHKIWNAFVFFSIGFTVPMLVLEMLFQPTGTVFWICAAVCFALGVLCAIYSKKLFKLQLFVTTFFIVYASVPSVLSFLGKTASVAAGFILAIAAGILSAKYKYIVLILTTAVSGAFMFFDLVELHTALPHLYGIILSVLFSAVGIGVQCYIDRKELAESLEEVKNQRDKIKKTLRKGKEKR